MSDWTFIAGYPVSPMQRMTHRVLRDADGYGVRAGGTFEGMSDHQLRDIGLSRCGGDSAYHLPGSVRDALNSRIWSGRMTKFAAARMGRTLRLISDWRARTTRLKTAPIAAAPVRRQSVKPA